MQVASISKFEGKGPIGLPGGDSVKAHHLLPFLPAFTAFVTRLQELLVGMMLHWSLLSGRLKAVCDVTPLCNVDWQPNVLQLPNLQPPALQQVHAIPVAAYGCNACHRYT